MPIIPLTYFDIETGKFRALLAFCTEEEREKYLMGQYDNNEYTFSATFISKYLDSKGFPVEISVDVLQKVTAGKYGTWDKDHVITLPVLQAILKFVDLDYSEFIDAYCLHLKCL